MSEINLVARPRRNRKSAAIRSLVEETTLLPSNLILPLFVMEGKNQKVGIKAMPGVERYSRDNIIKIAKEAYRLGIPAVALFPVIENKKKDKRASESRNRKGLLQNTIRDLKNAIPELAVITDVAMDPYSTDGHDGIVEKGHIINDATLPILAEMAISQAEAGADIVAPSDMMDGRVGFIRSALDNEGHENVSILSYAAKYASSFYGPFREALDSAPRSGDKKTYQMNPANKREALREVALDIEEGADIVMVKPAGSYLDIIQLVRATFDVPVAAYQVSGEYSMIKAAAEKGWIDGDRAMLESLLSIKRAGADMIFTYFAIAAAQKMAAAELIRRK